MKDFLGIKQVTKETFDSTPDNEKVGYMWFVRTYVDGVVISSEIYLGTRKYGDSSDGSGDEPIPVYKIEQLFNLNKEVH